MPETFVIAGASLAGGTAAATLREEGFDGKIVLIGEEPSPPYERPPLSKEYLRGEAPFDKALVRPADFYQSNQIDTRFGSPVVGVEVADRALEIEGGDRIAYDKLLITTGSRNRRIPIPGIDLDGVLDLRIKKDSDRIREHATSGSKAVIVGMGFIGAEVAASLRHMGVDVTVVEAFRVPLFKAVGEEIGRVFEAIHRDQGVEMIFEDQVAAFEGSGRAERMITKSGRAIECNFAIVGIGVEPVTDLVHGSGIKVDNGIVVDEHCRTNVESIFAAGDVTNHLHPVFARRMRVEHWQNAIKQGAAAAKNMMGRRQPYDDVHWFWSDQYDYNLQYAGVADGHDAKVTRGSLESRDFATFFLKEERLVAAIGLGRGKLIRQSLRLIKQGSVVEASKLKDDDFDLKSLIETR